MSKILKAVNKFNGNLCFVGSTDSGDIVFECNRQTHALSYDASSKPVTGISIYSANTYAVAFSDEYVGLYSSGILNEIAIGPLSVSNVTKILRNTSGEFYILNSQTNELIKYDSSIIWTVTLPDYSLKSEGDICLRESDGVVIYYNNSNIHLIRDDLTKGTALSSLVVSASLGELKLAIGGEFNPSYSYIRARTVSAPEILQSSSSSSESSSSSSSYVTNWSSSSESSSSNSSSSSSSSSYGYSSQSSSSSTFVKTSSSSSSSSYAAGCESLYLFCGSGFAGYGDGSYIKLGTYNGRPFWWKYDGSPGGDSYVWWDSSNSRWTQSETFGGAWHNYDDGTHLCPTSGIWTSLYGPAPITITPGHC